MARSLVIVESPAKAKTIGKYLGRDYTVKASMGHVMDLPKKTIGVRLPGDEPKKKKKGKPKKNGKTAAERAPKAPITLDDPEIFKPTLVIISGKGKLINDLRKSASSAAVVYLAADPDREGEAISAHLAMVLSKPARFTEDQPSNGQGGRPAEERESAKNKGGKGRGQISIPPIDPKRIFRVSFNEITPKAVRAAFEKPRQIDSNLVDAQQARRVLDRLVGYKISPLLWDKVRRGLSAGRVQTVALRLIVERERDIRAFVPKEYWTIHALLAAAEPHAFEAKLVRYKGEEIEIPAQAEAERIVSELDGASWSVAGVQVKEKRRHPPAPFTTSKLQQEAYNKLHFSAKRTMMLAQRLYEGIDLGEEGSVGLITYMRTDSVRVSNDALAEVRDFIGSNYGPAYLPERPNFYRSKKEAQEAHEAIRPTDVARTPDQVQRYLEEDLLKLYRLIWQRFVASQMTPAVFDQTTIDVAARDCLFRATGSVLRFDGFLAAYEAEREENEEPGEEGRRLPRVAEGEPLRLEKLWPTQHFTEPPPRYTEATLVKELEEKGIGRPSTYATIISTIAEREYVTREQGRFVPTLLGEKVNDLLVKSFEEIFDVGFTARMEEELDEIEEGKLPWKKSVKTFYERFAENLEQAKGEMESYKAGIPTDQKCEKCGAPLLERISRHGFFLGCSRYPECDFIRDVSGAAEDVESEAGTEYCPNCGREMVVKRGRFGPFLACTGYPECKTTRRLVSGTRRPRQPDVLLDEKCPECGSQLVRRQGRFGEFVGCSAYPKCKYIRLKTLGIACPKCGTGELVERVSRKGRARVFFGCSRYPECDFTTPHRPLAEPCPKCGAAFIVLRRTRHGFVRACLKEGCDWEAPAPAPPGEAEVASPAPHSPVQA
jgi:DNA topoisomerase I